MNGLSLQFKIWWINKYKIQLELLMVWECVMIDRAQKCSNCNPRRESFALNYCIYYSPFTIQLFLLFPFHVIVVWSLFWFHFKLIVKHGWWRQRIFCLINRMFDLCRNWINRISNSIQFCHRWKCMIFFFFLSFFCKAFEMMIIIINVTLETVLRKKCTVHGTDNIVNVPPVSTFDLLKAFFNPG